MASPLDIKDIITSILLETREEDIQKIQLANEIFGSILSIIEKQKKAVKKFEQTFFKTGEWLIGFILDRSNIPLYPKDMPPIKLSFFNRSWGNVRKSTYASANKKIDPETKKLTELGITIYFNAPPDVLQSTSKYNKWFAKNLESLIDNPSVQASFTHEFIHALDYHRTSPDYLVKRLENKKRTASVGGIRGPEHYAEYANDPLELNAFFSEAMHDLIYDIRFKIKDLSEFGDTAQEFADEFMNTYLSKTVRKYITPENRKRLMKRAATTWEVLKQKYP